MEVLLQSEYKKLGKKGDLVVVKPGYGRNYLIPQGIAIVANSANKKIALENTRQAARKALQSKADAEALVSVLDGAKVIVMAKVREHGHIFGTITPLQISKSLKEQNIFVDYTNIHLAVPIKNTGRHQAELILHREVSYVLNFEVVSA